MNTTHLLDSCLEMLCERLPDYPLQTVSVLRAAKLISKKAHDRANNALAPWKITYPEYNILTMLYGSSDNTLTPSELSQVVGEKSANITRLTNQLVDRNLISRSSRQDDRRKIAVTLTEDGVKMLQESAPAVIEAMKDLSDCEHLAELNELQKKLLIHFAMSDAQQADDCSPEFNEKTA